MHVNHTALMDRVWGLRAALLELPFLALLGLLPSPGASPPLLASSSVPALLGFRASPALPTLPALPKTPRENLPQTGADTPSASTPRASVSVHMFHKLAVPAGGRGQGEASLKDTYTDALRKGALDVARLWSLPGASSRCGTLQILITHSQGALRRRGAGMARGRQDGLGLQCCHRFGSAIPGDPE